MFSTVFEFSMALKNTSSELDFVTNRIKIFSSRFVQFNAKFDDTTLFGSSLHFTFRRVHCTHLFGFDLHTSTVPVSSVYVTFAPSIPSMETTSCPFPAAGRKQFRYLLFTVFLCYIGVTRSRKIESDRDYQKNKERVEELRVLWKKEKLLSTINKYIETFDINTIISFYFTNSHFKDF